MRVLQINKFFYEKGGSERYFFSVSRSLERRGHTVIHFSMRHPDNIESSHSEYFVGERDYSERPTRLDDVPKGFSFIRSKEAAARLDRLIKKTRPDIAHLHNIYHQLTPSIIPVLREVGIPVVMTLHDYKLICPNYKFFDGKRYCERCAGGRFYRAALTRCNHGSFVRSLLLSIEAYWQRMTRIYDGVRFFLAPSRYMRERFIAEGFGADRVIYLAPYVLDGARTGGLDDTKATLENLPSKYVLYFGRLDREKGLPTLFAATDRCDGVRLVVCGDGPLRQILEAGIGSQREARVTFTGYLSKPVLDRVVAGATVVVMPSEWPENAPFTVLEAMSHGVPVIVSNMGGLPEFADMGGCVVFEVGDSKDLAQRIEELWQNEELARKIGAEGRRAVDERLTEAKHMEALETIYRRALEERRVRG
ncbi:MAG: glycosyltransferase [Candidatus Latescibacterota bacterium]|nr:MAG: glycosyltransferase [Candidatus Latescibacterota bacterium]